MEHIRIAVQKTKRSLDYAQTLTRTLRSEFPPFLKVHKQTRWMFPELVGRSTFPSQYVERDSYQNTDTFDPYMQPGNSQLETFSPISSAQILTFMWYHSHTTTSKNYILISHLLGWLLSKKKKKNPTNKQKKKQKTKEQVLARM